MVVTVVSCLSLLHRVHTDRESPIRQVAPAGGYNGHYRVLRVLNYVHITLFLNLYFSRLHLSQKNIGPMQGKGDTSHGFIERYTGFAK